MDLALFFCSSCVGYKENHFQEKQLSPAIVLTIAKASWVPLEHSNAVSKFSRKFYISEHDKWKLVLVVLININTYFCYIYSQTLTGGV